MFLKVRLTKYRKGCTGFSEISLLLALLKVRLTKYRKGCTGFSEIAILQRVFEGRDVSAANAHDTKRHENVSSAMVVGPSTIAPDTVFDAFVAWPVKEGYDSEMNPHKSNG